MGFERERSSSDQNNTGQIMVTYSATTCRNRLYFILTIKTVTSAQKTTKRNDINEKAEIGVAAETSEKKT